MAMELVNENAQEIILDDSNEVSFPGFPYTFEALGEKILVSLDMFKSGYECKKCKGKGKLYTKCPCTGTDRVGFKYSSDVLAEVRATLGDSIADARAMMPCDECKGDPRSVEQEVTCPDCGGKTGLLVIPDTAKIIASSGVVISMGKEARAKADFKIGDRILFSVHSGSLIPTKSSVMFKQMDWYQAWIKVRGAEELGAFDFIVQPEVEQV